MKNIAIANGMSLTGYARAELAGKKSALELVGEYARALPGVDRVVLLAPAKSVEPVPPPFKLAEQADRSLPGFIQGLAKLASGYDNIFYFHADCPFLDGDLSARMLNDHVRYYADYTFADGYPGGLTPEILRTKLLEPLTVLAGESRERPGRQALFELIQKDINAFEIETIISPVDLRLLRLNLAADSKSNFLLLQRLQLSGGGESGSENICRLVQEKPELLRTLPVYFNIQIVEGCPQLCSYCPYPGFGIEGTGKKAEMAVSDFERLADKIHAFCGEAVVSVSLWGEPAYHSRIADIVRAVQDRPGLTPIIETSGIGWNPADLVALAGEAPLDWIVSLDAHGAESYEKLRGKGREEALETVQTLLNFFPGRVYVQAVRMRENEEDLELFYRHWKDGPARVIVQKYDHFCGLLPDKRVSDLSPLKRFPCWHIKRDLNVLLDGRVPLCREDVGADMLLGNLFRDELEAVWSAGEAAYLRHLHRDYPELCRKCDEYYTYNF